MIFSNNIVTNKNTQIGNVPIDNIIYTISNIILIIIHNGVSDNVLINYNNNNNHNPSHIFIINTNKSFKRINYKLINNMLASHNALIAL